MTALSNESVDPTRSALIKVKGRLQGCLRLGLGSARRGPLGGVPELKTDPIQPVLAPSPGLVGGTSRTTGITTRRRGKNQRREQEKIHPCPGVTMRDNTCKSSIQASTPKVASPAWDRGTKTDTGRENLVKRRHIAGRGQDEARRQCTRASKTGIYPETWRRESCYRPRTPHTPHS